MNFEETMTRLSEMGTDQNVKIYRRHGSGDNVFGVSFAMKLLKKEIKTDHDLAVRLWKTGNTDAMTLATMVSDPGRLEVNEVDSWVGDIDYYVVADQFATLVSKTSFAGTKMEEWMSSEMEYRKQVGYSILSSLLRAGTEIPISTLEGYLEEIVREIHSAPNRARYAMNNALISIGVFSPSLKDRAIRAAEEIGKVEVDHGETYCRTPDARSYIERTLKRRMKGGNDARA
jgi:3-methyladenine DNA glycosylase AlkD